MKACDLERRCRSAADVWCHVGGKPMRLCYHCAAEAVKAKQWVEYHWDADLEGECPPAAARVLSEAEREAQLANEDVQGKARQAAGHEDNPRTRVTDMGSKLRTLVLRANADKHPDLCRIADCVNEPKKRGLCDADYAAVGLRKMMAVYALPSQRPRREPEPAKVKTVMPPPPARAMSDSEILDAICKEMGIDADASPEAVIAKVRLRTLQSREFLEAVRDALRLREDLTPSDIVVNLRQLYAAAGDVGAAQSEARVFLADVRAQLKLAADATPEHCLEVLRQVYGQAADESQFWANINRWLTELRPRPQDYSTNPVKAVNELVELATARGRTERQALEPELEEIDKEIAKVPPYAQGMSRASAIETVVTHEAHYRIFARRMMGILGTPDGVDWAEWTLGRAKSVLEEIQELRDLLLTDGRPKDTLLHLSSLLDDAGYPKPACDRGDDCKGLHLTARLHDVLGAVERLRGELADIDAILGAGPPFAQPLLHPKGRPGALRSLIESESGYREVVCGVARALDLAGRNDGELGTVARVESLIQGLTCYRDAANATLRAALIRYVHGTETWAADLTDAELVEKIDARRERINEAWSTARKQVRELALMPDREDTTLLEYVQGVRERLQAEEIRTHDAAAARDEVIEDIWTAAGGVGQAPEWHELLSMVRGRLAPPRDTKREALTALFDEVEDQGEVSSFVVRAMRLLAGCDDRAVDDRTSAGVQDA